MKRINPVLKDDLIPIPTNNGCRLSYEGGEVVIYKPCSDVKGWEEI